MADHEGEHVSRRSTSRGRHRRNDQAARRRRQAKALEARQGAWYYWLTSEAYKAALAVGTPKPREHCVAKAKAAESDVEALETKLR